MSRSNIQRMWFSNVPGVVRLEDERFLGLARRTIDLPPPGIDYQGCWAIFDNGSGVGDNLVVCLKNFSGDWQWVFIDKIGQRDAILWKQTVGSAGTGNGQFNGAHSIAIDAAGNLYVSDVGNNRVQKFDPTGAWVLSFGTTGTGNGQFQTPAGIAIDAAGDMWVADFGNDRLQKFSNTGTYLTQFGSNGAGASQLDGPNGIAIDTDGNIWVVEQVNNRVQQFTGAGLFIRQFGSLGSGNGQFNAPNAIAIDAAGNLWVTDNRNNRVQQFDPTGAFLMAFGGPGSGNGQFASPRGIAVAPDGTVWVCDYTNDRIQRFSREGNWMQTVGQPGVGAGQMDNPRGIAFASATSFWMTNFNDSIKRFDIEPGEPVREIGLNGTPLASRPRLNLTATATVVPSVTDDAANGEIDLSFATVVSPRLRLYGNVNLRTWAAMPNATTDLFGEMNQQLCNVFGFTRVRMLVARTDGQAVAPNFWIQYWTGTAWSSLAFVNTPSGASGSYAGAAVAISFGNADIIVRFVGDAGNDTTNVVLAAVVAEFYLA